MTNEQLLDFIKKQLSLGETKEKIFDELLLNGWTKEDIEEGFNLVNNINLNASVLKNQIIPPGKKHFSLVLIFLILVILITTGVGFYFRDELKNLPIVKKIFPSSDNLTLDILPNENLVVKQIEDLSVDSVSVVEEKKDEIKDMENVENKSKDDVNQIAKNIIKEVLFKAKVSNVLMNSLLLDQGKKLTDFVELKLPGELYNPEKEFGVVSKELAKYDTPINAVISDFSAFKSGDNDWIINNFIKEEQNYPRSLLSNKDKYEKIKKHYSMLNKVKIKGEVKYKDYGIVLVQYVGDNFSDFLLATPFKKVLGEWKKTNALSGDLNMSIIDSALWNKEFSQVK